MVWASPCDAVTHWIRPFPVPSCLCTVRGHEWSACSKGMQLSSGIAHKVLRRLQKWGNWIPTRWHRSESIMQNQLHFSSKSKLFWFTIVYICCKPIVSSYNIDETEVFNQCKPKRHLGKNIESFNISLWSVCWHLTSGVSRFWLHPIRRKMEISF